MHAQQTHRLPCSIAGLSRNIIIYASHGNIAHPKHYQTLIHPQKAENRRFATPRPLDMPVRHGEIQPGICRDTGPYVFSNFAKFHPGSVAYMENEVRFADRLAPTHAFTTYIKTPYISYNKTRGINSTVHSLVNIGELSTEFHYTHLLRLYLLYYLQSTITISLNFIYLNSTTPKPVFIYRTSKLQYLYCITHITITVDTILQPKHAHR